MVKAGAILCDSGKQIPTRIDTICVHGDNAEAVALSTCFDADALKGTEMMCGSVLESFHAASLSCTPFEMSTAGAPGLRAPSSVTSSKR